MKFSILNTLVNSETSELKPERRISEEFHEKVAPPAPSNKVSPVPPSQYFYKSNMEVDVSTY